MLTQDASLPRVAADMCCLPFADRTFDWVLNFFTSFGYFETEKENQRVLEEIARVLYPGGRLLIDLFNPDAVVPELEKSETREMNGRHVEIERWYDTETRRVNKRIRVHSNTESTRTFLESVRAYSQAEAEGGLHRAGLEVTNFYGSFSGEPFRSDSKRLILVGRKPA